jgi:putative ABC transport system permease protein
MGYGRSMTPQGWTHGLRLGLRSLWRDVRAGELRLLMLSVSLAVAALTAVGFLADRMQSGLWRDARQLLGGDVVVVSDQATPALVLQTAQRLGLQFNTSVSFPTMARALPEQGGASKLVALKAVTQGYPCAGSSKSSTCTPLGQTSRRRVRSGWMGHCSMPWACAPGRHWLWGSARCASPPPSSASPIGGPGS